MMDFNNIITLIILLVILVVTPGPGMVTIIAIVGARGFTSGLALITGITFIHLCWVMIICLSFALIFDYILPFMPMIQIIGGCYLIFLGAKQYQGKRMSLKKNAKIEKLHFYQQFALGVLSSISNPKIIVFYISVLPNFIDLGSVTLADGALILLIVAIMIEGQLACVCLTAHQLHKRILNPNNATLINHVAGIILIIVGLYLIAQIMKAFL